MAISSFVTIVIRTSSILKKTPMVHRKAKRRFAFLPLPFIKASKANPSVVRRPKKGGII
jgi:hypothetical protein